MEFKKPTNTLLKIFIFVKQVKLCKSVHNIPALVIVGKLKTKNTLHKLEDGLVQQV